jgi:hypothetical protein
MLTLSICSAPALFCDNKFMDNFLLAINFVVSKMEHIPCCMLYFYCHNILRDENKKKGTVTGVGNNSLLDVQALGSLFRSLIYSPRLWS